ncbi:MAG: HEAT repeat domain-containing protein [Elusimicrobiales bacterium]|nr:HEAT repeat domain-containing protein [Elusimicrobiales bacterium]
MKTDFKTISGLALACAIGLAAGAWAAPLGARLVSLDDDARDAAISELGELSDPAKAKLVPGLVKALASKEDAVRYHAAKAIGEIGPAASAAIPALVKMLNDRGLDGNVAMGATDAMGRMGKAAVPLLIGAAGGSSMGLRQSATRALGRIGPAAGAAVPTLAANLKAGDELLKSHAAEALQRIGTPEALKALGPAK